jgi:hypothetical protein
MDGLCAMSKKIDVSQRWSPFIPESGAVQATGPLVLASHKLQFCVLRGSNKSKQVVSKIVQRMPTATCF